MQTKNTMGEVIGVVRRAWTAKSLSALIVFLGWGCLWAGPWAGAQPAADEPLSYRELFEEVWTVVAENFVGPAPGVDWFAVRDEYERKVTSARSDEEAYRYLAEMVALLGDPLTVLRTPQEVEAALAADDPSRYEGVGMMLLEYSDGTIVVSEVFDGGPARRAGIRKGSRLVAVDGAPVAGKSVTEVVQAIKGPAGSTVALTVADPQGSERTYSVRRAQISLAAEVKSNRLAGGIGYLAIPSFSQGTEVQVLSHLRRLYRTNGLIIDLRNLDGAAHPGSFLRIAGLFTDEPLGALYTRRGLLLLQPDRAWQGGTGTLGVPPPTRLDFWEKPIAIIVDGTTALSQFAVALVTGLRESGKAVVVGRGTGPALGVGTGQGVRELEGGGLLFVANSQLVSLREQRVIDALDVDRVVTFDQAYLEAWYRGEDLDIETARQAVIELTSR